MKSYEGRLGKLEKTLGGIFKLRIAIFVNKSKGETAEGKIQEIEKETGKQVDRRHSVIISVTGLERI